jgi:hypothetical protein
MDSLFYTFDHLGSLTLSQIHCSTLVLGVVKRSLNFGHFLTSPLPPSSRLLLLRPVVTKTLTPLRPWRHLWTTPTYFHRTDSEKVPNVFRGMNAKNQRFCICFWSSIYDVTQFFNYIFAVQKLLSQKQRPLSLTSFMKDP